MPDEGKRKRKKRNTLPPEQWYPVFLGVLENTGNVKLACSQARIDRRTVYRHRDANADFRAAWEDAMEDAGDGLEAEARRRAVVGVEKRKLLLYKGEPVIDFGQPGKWVDDSGQPWVEGVSRGRKRWTGAYLYEVETRYSDTLLTLLLKGAKPEKYADRMIIDQAKVKREAERVADALGVPLEALLDEIQRLRDEAT